MTNRWLTRALVAVAVPALLVPAVATSATAAVKPPAVPTLDAVAEIYPHLAGGYADITREKVTDTGKNCKSGDVIKGATGRDAFYIPKAEENDPAELLPTGEAPYVFVSAARFTSTKVAHEFLLANRTDARNCIGIDSPLGPRPKTTLKKIRVDLGAESWGYQVTWATKKASNFATALFVRKGNRVISVFNMAVAGSTAPSIPKSIDLARLAMKTAG